MRTITEAVASGRYSTVTAVMGSQMSKTDGVLLNLIGWKLDDDPEPILYIGPTEKNVQSIAGSAIRDTGRVGKMIRSVPSLWDGLAKGRDEKITEKWLNGVRLGFGWAGSATELASHPAALGLLDEYDRMTAVKGEGDPLGLLEARLSTFAHGVAVVTSTPLEGVVDTEDLDTGLTHWRVADPDDISSPTWVLWQSGTRHEWAVPCPDCRLYFIPRGALLWIPEGATPHQALREARLTCPHCAVQIPDSEKEAMNLRGRPAAPGQLIGKGGEITGPAPEGPNFSLWVSGLCSPWRSFGQRAAAIVAAESDATGEKKRVAINTGLGELYAERGDAPSWRDVYRHRRQYLLGEVPEWVKNVVAGIDVQTDCLYYIVRGWGLDDQSALLDYGKIDGDTSRLPVWFLLEKLLAAQYDGRNILRGAIDSGFNPGERINGVKQDIVYHFVRRHLAVAIATKGHDSLSSGKQFYASHVDVTWDGRTVKSGVQLWHVNSDWLKSWVHGRVKSDPADSDWHLPRDIDETYCRQIVAEERVIRGRAPAWRRTSRDNHYLDCEALAKAAAATIGIDRLSEQAAPAAPARRARKRGGGVRV